MALEIRWSAGGMDYQGKRMRINPRNNILFWLEKVIRFFHTVVSTKNTQKLEKITGDNGEDVEHIISKEFQCFHVSFQSTLLCNIRTENVFNSCKMSDMIRERGQFDNKKYWVIETYKSHQLYLHTYSCIDSIDHHIKIFRVKYMLWKYWNSPMLHTMSPVVVVDY